jgi:hypothetical protein
MKTPIFISLLVFPFCSFSRQDKKDNQDHGIGIGIKAGINFANIMNASSINSSSKTGFHLGAFFAPASKSFFGYRAELIYSKQSYNCETNSNTGSVNLNYIVLPQLTVINITKFDRLQVGFQFAYLISAKADNAQTSRLSSTLMANCWIITTDSITERQKAVRFIRSKGY